MTCVSCAEELDSEEDAQITESKPPEDVSDQSPTLGPSRTVRRELLSGKLDSTPTIQSRVVRIYISASFSGNLSAVYSSNVIPLRSVLPLNERRCCSGIVLCRSQWSSGSMPNCSARGPVIESRCGQLCLS